MRETKLCFSLIGLFLIFLLLFSSGGCAWLGGQFSSETPSSFKVGAVISEKYGGEKLARAFEYGLKLATEEINQNRKGEQPEIKLVVLKTRKNSPAELVRLALELEERKVAAVFCFLSEKEAKAFFPLASRLKRPVFLLSEVSFPLPSYVYSLSPSEEFKGAALASFCLSTLGRKKAAIFYTRGDRFRREKAYSFEKYFSQNGGEVALIRPYPFFRPKEVLEELKKTKPEVFFQALKDNKEFLKVLKKNLSYRSVWLFGEDLSRGEAKLAEGGYFVRFYPFSLDNLSEFSQKYREKFKANPWPPAFSSYLGLFVLNKAVIKARSAEGSLLAEALKEVKVEKAGGQYWFGKDKFLRGPAYFYQLKGGKVVLVKAEPLSF